MVEAQPDEPHLGPGHDVNMADVARLAGVSVATVSRALRDVPGVSETTRARVRDVATRMSYVVSPAASSLARRATRRVAVVVPRVDIWFYAAMLAALEEELRDAELDVLIYQVHGEDQRSRFVEELPARRKVDAVVLVALPLTPEEAARLTGMGAVVVAGGRLGTHLAVHVDDHQMACDAVGHLADLGHTRIAMIRTNDTDGTQWSSDLERTRGYRDTVTARGLDDDPALVVTMPYSVDAGARAMEHLLGLPDPPTAVFAYSDELALGAASCLTERGMRVPEDVSLIGVDGHPTAALLGLDTVDQHVAEQGRQAGLAAARQVHDPAARTGATPDIVVPHELVLRGSTAAPRAGALPRRRRR